ncbi:hypothetical protein [Streptomyces sp. NPDC021020]|uniref:hypothetical protein n=1 Tax=Streptomyces sp. NPDC021020 TaxID=3365109 RepID=UPI0037ACC752
MIDKRIAAGFALVAGLGLASVAAAPVSGAATPSAAHAAHAQPAGKDGGKSSGKGGAKGGKQVVCIVQVGKPGGKGGPVTLPPLPGRPGGPGKGTGDKVVVKVVNGKVTVYVNGKPAPAGSVHVGTGAECPAPPKGLPGAGGVTTQPGKGGVSVHPGAGGVVLKGAPGADEAGLTVSGLHV